MSENSARNDRWVLAVLALLAAAVLAGTWLVGQTYGPNVKKAEKAEGVHR